MPSYPTILVFDSGLGGLTVLREVVGARPDARYVYVADDAFFPYGGHSEAALIARVVPLLGELIAAHRARSRRDRLQHRLHSGAEPSARGLQRAVRRHRAGDQAGLRAIDTKRVSVLGTSGTVQREYTSALIRDFAQACAVTLVGSPRLASLAEAALDGGTVADADILAEIAPCFVEIRRRTHRYGGAGLHALSASARPADRAGAVAGGLDRPGAGDRPPGLDLLGPAAGGADPPAKMIFTSGRAHAPAMLARFFGGRIPACSASRASRRC